MSSEESNVVLDKVTDMDSSEMENKYLTFWTAGQLFGIPIADVMQIIGIQEITNIPEFPEYAKGIINLRGSIIPVIDVRIRLRKPEAEYNERTCIINTNMDDSYFGFIVDAVDEVADILPENISEPPKMNGDYSSAFLTGVGRIGEKIILILDVRKMINLDELSIVSSM